MKAGYFAWLVGALVGVVACGGEPPSSSDTPAESALESARPSAALKRAVRELESEWGDENIMNGQAHVASTKLRASRRDRSDQIRDYAKASFEQYAAADDFTLVGAASASNEPATAAVRAAVAKVVAVEGFVYTPSEANIGPVRERIEGVLAKLGEANKIDLFRYEGKGKISLDDGEGEWKAHLFAFVNRDTGDVVTFFVREGWT